MAREVSLKFHARFESDACPARRDSQLAMESRLELPNGGIFRKSQTIVSVPEQAEIHVMVKRGDDWALIH
jgi:hypothetical protein